MLHWTPLIDLAIRVAATQHQAATRKVNNVPYITHPFAVASILADFTNDETTIVSALLHDTIEDTSYDPADLEANFGQQVLAIVQGVTEDKSIGDWQARKDDYFQALAQAPRASKMIAVADRMHNLYSLMDEYQKHGDDMWDLFGSSPARQIWATEELLTIVGGAIDVGLTDQLTQTMTAAKEMFGLVD
ncbi:MAG: HD domain-containing protein [Patescibacteria group bacterium]